MTVNLMGERLYIRKDGGGPDRARAGGGGEKMLPYHSLIFLHFISGEESGSILDPQCFTQFTV